MVQEYRYPLTRVCLRGGTMTLPRTMVGLFPDQGNLTLLDTTSGQQYSAEMSHPRVVAGLSPLFRAHELDVNDELLIVRRGEGLFDVTPLRRQPTELEPAEPTPTQAQAEQPNGPAAEPGTERAAQTASARPAPATTEAATDLPKPNLDPRAAVAAAESALLELEGGAAGSSAQAQDVQADLWEPEGGAPAADPPRPYVTPRGAAHETEQDNEAAMVAVALSARLRRAFAPLGYRVEPLAAGVLFLHAELGRRRYKVLVQLLRSGERLDWAALLARRRAMPADYLAVMGDGVDLVRLTSPADLARATLWSWQALERLAGLHQSVVVTPLDLQSHFSRDGLFEEGLKRLERSVTERVAERGATSEVLTHLALVRAPGVFLLEELAQDVGISRDEVLKILERLAEAPLHLVAKVGNGEFLLRQQVDHALSSLAAYAESLRQRLPRDRRMVMAGLDDGMDEPAPQDVEPAADAE